MERDKFGCITCREFRTGGGQLVEFWCRPEDADKVLAALKNIKNFEIIVPTTKRVKEIGGGKYGHYTRYDIVQVKKEGSWLEVLQINDPPDNRCGNILLAWLSSTQEGRTFFEFDTIENACGAFKELKKAFGRKKSGEVLKMPGCLRVVKCGKIFKPWFYAVADQALWGDVVFPDTVKEDELFQFGKKYIVEGFQGIHSVKTCVGVEQLVFRSGWKQDVNYRRVLWHDGTFTDCEENQRNYWPKPLEESQLWIQEAINLFRDLLSGVCKAFEIPFQDGSKFVGQWKSANPKDKTVAGRYWTSLTLENGKKVESYFDFTPTPEMPTAVSLIEREVAKKGLKIKEIHSLAKKSGGIRGKSWVGVF